MGARVCTYGRNQCNIRLPQSPLRKQSTCSGMLDASLGVTARSTRLTTGKRLFWAAGVSDAEQPKLYWSQTQVSAKLASSQPDTSDGLATCVRQCAACPCLMKCSNSLTPVAVGAWGSSSSMLSKSVIA